MLNQKRLSSACLREKTKKTHWTGPPWRAKIVSKKAHPQKARSSGGIKKEKKNKKVQERGKGVRRKRSTKEESKPSLNQKGRGENVERRVNSRYWLRVVLIYGKGGGKIVLYFKKESREDDPRVRGERWERLG